MLLKTTSKFVHRTVSSVIRDGRNSTSASTSFPAPGELWKDFQHDFCFLNGGWDGKESNEENWLPLSWLFTQVITDLQTFGDIKKNKIIIFLEIVIIFKFLNISIWKLFENYFPLSKNYFSWRLSSKSNLYGHLSTIGAA